MPLDVLRFLKEALLRPNQTGAILPTSRFLADEMIRAVDPEHRQRVVEVGPGTGAITEHLLVKMMDRSDYLGIDANGQFVARLHDRFPKVRFVHNSAEHLPQYLEAAASVDHVICSLPWAFFTEPQRVRILNALTQTLKAGGTLSTYAYVHGRMMPTAIAFRRELEDRFEVSHSPVIWRNVPPALVYHCLKRNPSPKTR